MERGQGQLSIGLGGCGSGGRWRVAYDRYRHLQHTLDPVLARSGGWGLRLASWAGELAGLVLLMGVLGGCTDLPPHRAALREEPTSRQWQKWDPLLDQRIIIWTSGEAKHAADRILAAAQRANRPPRVPEQAIAC